MLNRIVFISFSSLLFISACNKDPNSQKKTINIFLLNTHEVMIDTETYLIKDFKTAFSDHVAQNECQSTAPCSINMKMLTESDISSLQKIKEALFPHKAAIGQIKFSYEGAEYVIPEVKRE